MKQSYQFLQNAKKALKKTGLLNFFGTAYYSVYCKLAHWKCSAEARKRANGYLDKRYEQLREFAGIHEGERCFIVCTGPSLTVKDVDALKGEYTFGLNSITKMFPKTDWRPTYYVIEDLAIYISLENELQASNLKHCFTSDLLIKKLNPKVDFIAYPFDRRNHPLVVYHPSTKPDLAFSGNAYSIVNGAYSVTFSAMQLAVYMGFKEIYLIGCDCDYSGTKKHFENFTFTNVGPTIKNEYDDVAQKMILSFEVAREYCDAHGIRIFNATRGGKLEVFERVDIDEVIGRKKEDAE